MTFSQDMARLAQSEGQAAAAAMVERCAAAGEPDALMMLGHWRLWGLYGPRDPVAGHAAIGRAADAGLTEAVMVRAALLATGTGAAADIDEARRLVETQCETLPIAARQIALLDAMTDDRPPVRTLRADPMMSRIDALLTPDECAYLVERAMPIVRPSVVIDPRTRQRIPNPVRDSHGGNFGPTDEDVVIHAINRRIAAVTDTTWAQGESLHILRYEVGQQYRRHLDALPGVSNQRVLTVLIYLNDGYVGGETGFAGGLTVKGGVGDAVIFANTDAAGRADPRTEHAGLPVTQGTKWLATRWIRAQPHDPWAP